MTYMFTYNQQKVTVYGSRLYIIIYISRGRSRDPLFFFLNDPAPPEIYPLPLPAPLPISIPVDLTAPASVSTPTATAGDGQVQLNWTNPASADFAGVIIVRRNGQAPIGDPVTGATYSVDRKSTRLNSSHDQISYAVFCLKK